MKYILRYNVEHKNGQSDRKWKVYSEDGSESFLVDRVIINTGCWTEDTPYLESVKYSIVAIGQASLVDSLTLEIN